MSVKITFLGTSSMVPTKQRNVQSIHISYKGEGILVDCGEGTQRQMNIAGINRLKVRKILISHWHGDHISGLIGLIQTMGDIFDPETILNIYGPIGSKEKMYHLMRTCEFKLRIKIKIHELDPKTELKFFENKDYYLECTQLKHGIPCLGYSFNIKDKLNIDMKKVKKLGLKQGKWLQQIQNNESVLIKKQTIHPKDISTIKKGKKITFILDTSFCKNAVELAKNSNLLISECVYDNEFKEQAKKYKHMIVNDVLKIAEDSKSKQVILTHLSQRYKKTTRIKKNIKNHSNVSIAEDFMVVNV